MGDTNGHKEMLVFGSNSLDPLSRNLLVDGKEVHLPRRPFDILVNLIENRERVVSRAELLDKFWEGHDVYDDALRKCIGSIRKALHDEHRPSRIIETRYGGGYRFIADITTTARNGNASNGSNGAGARMDAARLNGGAPKAESNAPEMRGFPYVPIALTVAVLLLILTLGFYVFDPREQSAANLISPGDGTTAIRSVAVMPIKNLTGDPANEYFSDGVTESIITELSRVSELRIVSRGSTFAFKGEETDPRDIGRRLNTEALLEGSLRKKGDLFSVSVRLVSTQDGHVIWTSRDFERGAANAHELQDTISCNVAIELRSELCDPTPTRNTTNAEAYQAYLKGRFHWNKRTASGINTSIAFYEQAIRLDPKYALAYAGLAESYVQGIWHVPFVPKEVLPKAKEAALKALELDENLAEAHVALASVHQLNWNWAEGERSILSAIELNPRNARAHHVHAFCLLILGRNDDAIASIERARELDPLNLVINTDKAQILFAANRNDEALAQWSRTLELDPNFKLAYEHRAIANLVLGNEPAAIEDYSRVMELSGQSAPKIAAYRESAARAGIKGLHRREVTDMLAKEKRGETVWPFDIASLYTSLGQKDGAFRYLEKIYGDRGVELLLVRTDRRFDPLKTDPRFADLFKRAGLPDPHEPVSRTRQ